MVGPQSLEPLPRLSASRDLAPKDAKHFTAAESETLGRLCRDAYLACEAARTTIAEMRRRLWQGEQAYDTDAQA